MSDEERRENMEETAEGGRTDELLASEAERGNEETRSAQLRISEACMTDGCSCPIACSSCGYCVRMAKARIANDEHSGK